ncbi:MAG: hypothetical protein FWG98_06890 [Candidatus Cloacimonetes bacterium]|nr:hypothetical protein [Candidatus Cloacimonadota bacterium]
MKPLYLNENCYAFETMNEFMEAFEKYAERKGMTFGHKMIVKGNSDLTFGEVQSWVNYFGVENVYMSYVDGDFDSIDEFYFDLRNAQHNGDERLWLNADEVFISHGFLRIWFD